MIYTLALALAAAVLDVTVGYPTRIARAVGAPTQWLTLWFRIVRAAAATWSGSAALAIYLGPVAVACILLAQLLPSGPIGFGVAALLTSTLCGRQALNRSAVEVARVWETEGPYEALAVAEELGGDEGETRLARASAAAIGARFADEVAALTVFTLIGGLVGAALCRALTIAGRYSRSRADESAFARAVRTLERWTIAPAARWGALLLAMAAALLGDFAPLRAVAAPASTPTAPAEAVMLRALGNPQRDEPSYVRGAVAQMRRAAAIEIVALIALTFAAAVL